MKKFKKYLPYIFLALLTIALMLFFKHNKKGISKILEAGKNNLMALAQNLKPLLFRTELTNEDVFNFALYQSLPIDKEKTKVLSIRSDEISNNIYEIRPATYNTSTKNYETFVKYLALNENQKASADSILDSYKKEIYSSVLANEKNTYAVNPKILDLQKAVLADLVSFAHNVNAEKSNKLFPKSFEIYDRTKFSSLSHNVKELPANEYILISPDTVAKTFFDWDKSEWNKKYAEIVKKVGNHKTSDINFQYKIKGEGEETHSLPSESDLSFKLDSNLFKVIIPKEALSEISHVVSDSIRIKLNEAAKQLKTISIPLKWQSGGSKQYKSPPEAGSSKNGISKIIDPFEIVNKTMEMLSKANFGNLEKFEIKMDSLTKGKNFNVSDSAGKAKLKEQIKKWSKNFKKSLELTRDSIKSNQKIVK